MHPGWACPRPPAPQHLPRASDPKGDSQGGQGACSQSDLSERRSAGHSTLGSRNVTFFQDGQRAFLTIVEDCVDKLPPSACRVRTCSGPRAPPPCSYTGFQSVKAPRGGCCPEQGKRGGFCAGLSNNPSSENSTLSEQDEAPKPCPALHPESLNPRDRNSSVDQNMCLDLKARGLRRTAGPLKTAGPVSSHRASERQRLGQRLSERPLSPRQL